MPNQVSNGKSFEWSVAKALSTKLGVPVLADVNSRSAKSKYEATDGELRSRQDSASGLAIEHIVQKELSKLTGQRLSHVLIAPDRTGQGGDVRDIIARSDVDVLGISCKNNHKAFKHSRLSPSIDFVDKWGLSPNGVSQEYIDETSKIFSYLDSLRKSSNGRAKWNEIDNKRELVYDPILSAFERELIRVIESGNQTESILSKSLVQYIVGGIDFYKVICGRSLVEILGFNFHHSLAVQHSTFPTEIHSIERDSRSVSTTILRFREGHTFSFRLHNASTLVEPSLKFDIQALSLPSSKIYTNHIDFPRG